MHKGPADSQLLMNVAVLPHPQAERRRRRTMSLKNVNTVLATVCALFVLYLGLSFILAPEAYRGPYEYSVPGAAKDFTPQHEAS